LEETSLMQQIEAKGYLLLLLNLLHSIIDSCILGARSLDWSPRIEHFQFISTCDQNSKNRSTYCWCGRGLS